MFFNSSFNDSEDSLKTLKDGEVTPRDIKIACVAILLKMAHADNKISETELNIVYRATREYFRTDESEAGDIIEVAKQLQKDSKKTSELVVQINSRMSVEQRQKILSTLWKIIKADGIISEYELSYATRVRALLNLTLEQAMAARAMSEK